jgi:hypothetical protein
MSKLQKKPSALERERPALQNMKFLNFFLLLWVIFAVLDPDPMTRLSPDPQPWPPGGWAGCSSGRPRRRPDRRTGSAGGPPRPSHRRFSPDRCPPEQIKNFLDSLIRNNISGSVFQIFLDMQCKAISSLHSRLRNRSKFFFFKTQ